MIRALAVGLLLSLWLNTSNAAENPSQKDATLTLASAGAGQPEYDRTERA